MAGSMAWAQVSWKTTFAAGAKEAAASKKPILIDFTAEWCGPCKMMEKDVFTDPAVRSLMSKAVCVRLDVDTKPAEAQRFGVNSIPRLILLDPTGKKVLMDATGYQAAPDFAAQLANALGVKVPVVTGSPATGANAPPELAAVQKALAANGLAKLKAEKPEVAAKGMKLLVKSLGVFEEGKLKPAQAQLVKSGSQVLPYLIEGMGDKELAVRAASYRVALAIIGSRQKAPAFDPWASSKKRSEQVVAFRKWLSTWNG